MRWVFYILIVFCIVSCHPDPELQQAVSHFDTVVKKPDTVPSKSPLQLAIQQLTSDPTMKNASFGFLISDAETGEVINEVNPDLSLIPASTMKLFTTAAALEILGPDRRFRTELCYQGEVSDGVLYGNLVIKGGGDPTLGIGDVSRKGLYASWINLIKKAGIDSVTGSVIGDGTIFDKDYIPYTWTWGEINLAYCASASGLSLNGNTFRLIIDSLARGRFKPSLQKVTPYIPDQYFESQMVETEIGEEEIYLVGHPFSDQKMIRGVIPKGKRAKELVAAISNPPLAFATDFRNALQLHGIRIAGGAYSLADSDSIRKMIDNETYTVLSWIISPSVESMVFTVNHNSYNFFAETLLKHIGLKIMRYGSTDAGARAVYNFFRNKGMDTDGFSIFDGSGISRYNSVTPRQMIWVLQYMTTSGEYETYRNSLSVAGVSGTLGHLLDGTPAEGNLQGKSGTMSRVKSYAGYLRTSTGRELIFAAIVNNFNCSGPEMTKKLEAVMAAMAR